MKFVRKLLSLLRRDSFDAEMTEEMRHHVELQTELNMKKGLVAEDARYAAFRQFGGVVQVQEQCRDARRFLWTEQFLQDARHATRSLLKTPGFTGAAVLVLALGIGLNTATFSAVYTLVFRPPPLPEPARLVQLYTQDRKEPASFRAFSHAAYRDLREQRDLFAGVLAQKLALVAVGEGTEVRRAFSAMVSANFFEVLGAPLARGRGFTLREENPGADEPVVVVSHTYWRNTGFRPDLVGSPVRINGRLFTIVGIAPENFHGTMAMLGPDLYLPLGVFDSLAGNPTDGPRRSLARPDVFPLVLVARLQAGISSAAAGPALAGVAAGLERNYPVEYHDKTIVLGPLPHGFPDASPANDGPVRLLAVTLLGLTGAVLLIVSLNLAGLFLVRGHARRKEFAVRLALGSTRARLVRQLLTEGLVLALAGGALGCACAVWVSDLVIAAVSTRLPVEIFLSTGAPAAVVGATLVFSTLATLFFALGPALTLARRDLLHDLQRHSGEDGSIRRHRWLPRHPLVVAQIALSLALMIGAGLFARMVGRLIAAEPGVDAGQLLVIEFDASLGGHDPARTLEVFRTVSAELAAVPGVHSVSIASSTPYSLAGNERSVRRAGTRPAAGLQPATVEEGLAFSAPANAVGADYFATLGVPLLRGRAFTPFESDHAGAPPVAIVDETLAALLWPGEDPLGRRLEWANRAAGESADPSQVRTIEIVGIARQAPLRLKGEKSTGAIYVPFAQGFTNSVFFFVRSREAGENVLAGLREPLRRALRAAAPEIAFSKVSTFAEHKDGSLELWLLYRLSTIATGFGVVAALIAVIGLYGAKAYGVSRRTREIGIRLALGAEPACLRNLILREGLASGLLGVGFGLLLGGALGRLFGSAMADVSGFDPWVFGLAAGAVFAASLAASWIPAHRAMKVNPLTALRAD
jgi:predicted permease